MSCEKSPSIIPEIFPRDENLPEYRCFDSGISSQVTMQSMQPAAKLRENPIKVNDIEPKIAPKKAPKPVIIPERVVMSIAFDFEIPLFFSGSEIDIPSGIS